MIPWSFLSTKTQQTEFIRFVAFCFFFSIFKTNMMLILTIESIYMLNTELKIGKLQWCLFANRSVFGEILFLLVSPPTGDRHNRSHLSRTDTNMAFFSKTAQQIKFVKQGTTVMNPNYFI